MTSAVTTPDRGCPGVHVMARDGVVREAVLAKLFEAGMAQAGCEPVPGAVVVAAGATVDDALEACPVALRGADYQLVIAAQALSPAGVVRAVRAGARTLLQLSETTPDQLADALCSAAEGSGRLPYAVLVRLLSGAAELCPPGPPSYLPTPSSLTSRQLAVLRLVAEGHGNSAIARALSCSDHTVKNTIYDLMARLQARNRAHAVAHAVRAGLI